MTLVKIKQYPIMEFKKATIKNAQEEIQSRSKERPWVGPKGRESNIHEREKIQT